MTTHSLRKLSPLLYLALFGIAVSIVSGVLWFKANKGNDDLYFGTVTHMQGETFEIADAFNGQLSVVIATSTAIYKGPDAASRTQLADGVFVQVVGTRTGSVVDASVIRVMNQPRQSN